MHISWGVGVGVGKQEGRKCFIYRRTQHILFTVIWRRTYGKEPLRWGGGEGRKEMFYLTTHSTHFIYDYMASDIW